MVIHHCKKMLLLSEHDLLHTVIQSTSTDILVTQPCCKFTYLHATEVTSNVSQ